MGAARMRFGGKTSAELRLELADDVEAKGDHDEARALRAFAGQIMNEAAHGGLIVRPGERPRKPFDNSPVPVSTGWVHGDGIVACACGFAADYLCDWPTGGGKTCDLPICEDCRTHGGNGRQEWDWCPQHAGGRSA